MDTAAERRRIGLAIGILRTRQGRSLAALGALACCSRELVRRAEGGDPGVPLARLRAICAALGLDGVQTESWIEHLDHKTARDARAHAALERLPYLKEGLAMLPTFDEPWTAEEQRPVVAPLMRMALDRLRCARVDELGERAQDRA